MNEKTERAPESPGKEKTGTRHPRSWYQGSRWLAWLGITLTLMIFAAAIFLVSLHLRAQMRQQLIDRDGEVLHSVAAYHFQEELETWDTPRLNPPGGKGEAAPGLTAWLSQGATLKTSSLREVIATRIFDAKGRFLTPSPSYVKPTDLSKKDLRKLRQLEPVTRFHPKPDFSEIFLTFGMAKEKTPAQQPLLEVIVPLHRQNQQELLATAQFIFAKKSLPQQFASLDRKLFLQGGIVFLVGGAIIVGLLGWAFQRLQFSNRLLNQRTQDLLRANEELTIAAKSSAVGAVTGHLMHGLKNPLFSLQLLANQLAENEPEQTDSRWRAALDTTKRIQTMVNEVTQVLSDSQSLAEYELSLTELKDILDSKVAPAAEEAQVEFTSWANADGFLSNRTANLVILILQNLIHNAIHATPAGKKVQLVFTPAEEGVAIEVHDEGPGVSEAMQQDLFTPQKSSKPGGSGIGLAISKQLANHIGATLELKTTSENGSVFQLCLPSHALEQAQMAFSRA